MKLRAEFRGERLEIEPSRWPAGIDRAAVCWPPSPRLLALVLGALESGAELALLNTRLTQAERDAQLAALGLSQEVDGVHISPGVGTQGSGRLLLFTSGTTGTPKAAVLHREALEANARAAIEVLQIDEGSRLVCAMPLFHVGGIGLALRCALSGATLLLHEKFDAAAVARELQTGATHVSLVATTLEQVLQQVKSFTPTVKVALIGGGPVPKPLLDRARAAGLPVLQTYGLTETCSMATCERPDEADGATAGRVMPGIEVRIVEGEIEVRGPQLMRGYLGHEPVRDWFATGDLGQLDDQGRLTIWSRREDLIVSGGENVYPAEIEAALLDHPRVREAAVVPEAHEKWGQVGVAWVVGEAGETELRAWLENKLARYKIPARFLFAKALPRNASGKVIRAALRPGASPASPAAGE